MIEEIGIQGWAKMNAPGFSFKDKSLFGEVQADVAQIDELLQLRTAIDFGGLDVGLNDIRYVETYESVVHDMKQRYYYKTVANFRKEMGVEDSY
jgi:hypothetical protein